MCLKRVLSVFKHTKKFASFVCVGTVISCGANHIPASSSTVHSTVTSTVTAMGVTLSGTPTNPSSTTALDITVGGVEKYAYVITTQLIPCSVETYSSTWIDARVPISDPMSISGNLRLCVIWQNPDGTASSVYQAKSFEWTETVLPSSNPTTSGPSTTGGANATVATPTPPDFFAGIQSFSNAGGHHALLTWNPPTGGSFDRYVVYLGTTPGGENFSAPVQTLLGLQSLTTALSALSDGTTYYAIVRASDGTVDDGNTVELSLEMYPYPTLSQPLTGPLPQSFLSAVLSYFSIPAKAIGIGEIGTVAGRLDAPWFVTNQFPTVSRLATFNSGYQLGVNQGSLYFADPGDSRVLKFDSFGNFTNFIGTGTSGYAGDGGQSSNALIKTPLSFVFDGAGNAYVSDFGSAVVRKVTTNGIISTFAGNGSYGYSGDGGPATSANMYPRRVTVDVLGNVYITDTTQRIRKVTTNGVISTIAGTGNSGFSGDGGLATSAQISGPEGVLTDSVGNVFFTDYSNNRIRVINTAGIISTIAGNGTQGATGDTGPATNATLHFPAGLHFDSVGNLNFADGYNYKVRSISTAGIISTIAGTGISGFSGDGGPAISALLGAVQDIQPDSNGVLWVSAGNTIRKITSDGLINTFAGRPSASGISPDGIPATTAAMTAFSVLPDPMGNIYIVDTGVNRIRKIDTNGIIHAFAGTGTSGYAGDGGPAVSAALSGICRLAIDTLGNVYIADSYNFVVRKVNPAGVISTFAGNGMSGVTGNGVAATSASFIYPNGLTADPAGNIYVTDRSAALIRKIDTTGMITTFAGKNKNAYSWTGDGGPATAAAIGNPWEIAADSQGNIYFADTANSVVRKVNTAGIISTVAGTGNYGNTGDGGPATSAKLGDVTGLAVDSFGNIFVSDTDYISVRMINSSGIISTLIGGISVSNFTGDGGPASSASITSPQDLNIDSLGNLYIGGGAHARVIRLH